MVEVAVSHALVLFPIVLERKLLGVKPVLSSDEHVSDAGSRKANWKSIDA